MKRMAIHGPLGTSLFQRLMLFAGFTAAMFSAISSGGFFCFNAPLTLAHQAKIDDVGHTRSIANPASSHYDYVVKQYGKPTIVVIPWPPGSWQSGWVSMALGRKA